jgi:hypothetical protein
MPRYFTLRQAEELLTDVEPAIRNAIALKTEYERMESAWRSVAERVAAAGGMRVDRAQLTEDKQRREQTARELTQAVERIQSAGCLVKDLDMGLIDFPTLFQGQEVYLCWRLGERGIRFWHGTSEGFRGRKPIDEGFLEQHRGELPN